MANYNYVALDNLKTAMRNTAVLNGITIVSSRGNTCDIKLDTWCHNDEEHAAIIIDGEKSHRTIVDNDSDGGITLGHFVFDILLAMNCKLKTNDGRCHELNINSDMWYCNNPKSELFGKLIDVTNGGIIC